MAIRPGPGCPRGLFLTHDTPWTFAATFLMKLSVVCFKIPISVDTAIL